MRMNSQIICLLILVLQANCTMVLQHECAHNKLWSLLKQNIDEYHSSDDGRKLEAQEPRQLKITYDMSFFDKNLKQDNPLDMQFRKYAEQAIQISTKYFSDLITAVPKPFDAMKINQAYCVNIKVPIEDQQNGRDSDLHLYITFTNEPTQSYLAYAGACRLIKGYGPSHGIVNFNYGLLGKYDLNDTLIGLDLVEIVTHEMTHVLGFSPSQIPQWTDENKQPHQNPTQVLLNRGLKTTFLATPNVLNYARKYYGCSNLPGMPLENQGLSGSVGSHWEITAIQDEIMTAAIAPHLSIYTGFTTALLRDTGYYATVGQDLEENSFFGKNQGCGFVLGSCDDYKKEFCSLEQTMTCDFYRFGTSHCSQNIFIDNQCHIQRVYFNSKCYRPQDNYMNTASFIKQRGIGFGANSRCFNSSLMKLKTLSKTYEMGLCYQFECNEAHQVIIAVGDTKVTCNQDGEVLNVPGYIGTIKCPDKLEDFCGFKQFCPNNCSYNGYCMKGKCHCLPQYSGNACEISS